jgi:hypothetical protein
MFNFFMSLLKLGHRDRHAEDATSQMLCKLIAECPVCRRSLKGHYRRLVATTSLRQRNDGKPDPMLSALIQHDWSELVEFQEWEGDQPNAEVYLIECPSGGFSVSMIRSPFQLGEPDVLMHQERELTGVFPSPDGAQRDRIS